MNDGGVSKYDPVITPLISRSLCLQHLKSSLLTFLVGVARQALSDQGPPLASVPSPLAPFVARLRSVRSTYSLAVSVTDPLPEPLLRVVKEECLALSVSLGLEPLLLAARAKLSNTIGSLQRLRAFAGALRHVEMTDAVVLGKEKVSQYEKNSQIAKQVAEEAIKRPGDEDELEELLEALTELWQSRDSKQKASVPRRTFADGRVEEPGSAGWRAWISGLPEGTNLWMSAKAHRQLAHRFTSQATEALIAANPLCASLRKNGFLGLHALLERICTPPSAFKNAGARDPYLAHNLSFSFRCRLCAEHALSRVSSAARSVSLLPLTLITRRPATSLTSVDPRTSRTRMRRAGSRRR